MRLYNTLTRHVDELPPAPGPVRMYFCGPTVYARAHVGNAVPFVLGMWLRRWLRERGYDVQLVHNITDINDKIYEAAPGASAELAARATEWYLVDTADLGLGMPDRLPRATEYIPQIVRFIEQLITSGHAYAAQGDVYFRVSSYPQYGQLSGQRPEQMEPEEQSSLKEDPRDFALWKATKEGEDTRWESPWGLGRPGWHIECSVMAEELLGPMFEIHGGGLDLVFPHHENELAQSRAVGHEFAELWMHNGLLRFTGEKMSKSVGNVTTIREALDEYGREALLLFFMTGHWRKPLDFSAETMAQAQAQAEGFRNAFRDDKDPGNYAVLRAPSWEAFQNALDDDFNTPAALAILHEWRAARMLDLMKRGFDVFGLASLAAQEAAPPEIVSLAERREAARAERDFAAADELREQIEAAGWEVRDVAEGFQLVPK